MQQVNIDIDFKWLFRNHGDCDRLLITTERNMNRTQVLLLEKETERERKK